MIIWLGIGLTVVALAFAGALLRRRAGAPATAPARAPDPEEVDDELREVFVGEARGEIGQLRRALPRWRTVPADLDRVVPLRRSFHTLKGSSRLVGAYIVGDFCAAIERLLLAVVEGSVPPEPAVIDTVARAVAMLPALLAEYTGERNTRTDVSALARTAERLLRADGAVAAAHRRVARPLRAGPPR